jgi:hypothetical protein
MSVNGLREAGTAKVYEGPSAAKCSTQTFAAGEQMVSFLQFFCTHCPCDPNVTTMRATPRAFVDLGKSLKSTRIQHQPIFGSGIFLRNFFKLTQPFSEE